MAFKPTPEQRSAIEAPPNLLVSAAAGSGKTAVLVERVMRRLTDPVSPVSADRLLIVTFTNPAAAEMKARLEKRLDAECRAHPQDVRLLRQKQLFSSAKICTIDSFCIDLVREHFEAAGVSPDFRISDGFSLRPIDETVLKRLLESCYEQKDPAFFRLLDLVGAEYDDGNFCDFILQLYDYSRQLADPTAWFESLPAWYDGDAFGEGSSLYGYAVTRAGQTAKEMSELIASTIDILTGEPKAADRYLADFTLAAEKTAKLAVAAESRDWNAIYEAVTQTLFPSFPRALPHSYASAAAKESRRLLNGYVERLAKLFYADRDFIAAQLSELREPVELLAELLKRFEQDLFEEYCRRNVFTFHNTEHLALKLLTGDTADAVVARFDEVMVDEYQDTNDLQDRLFEILSAQSRHLFVVGDVKQSIYGFRGANPLHFLQKKEQANPVESDDDTQTKKVVLGANFRSRTEICDYVNDFFSQLMTKQTGKIIYGEEEKLFPKANYPQAVLPPVCLEWVEVKGDQETALCAEAKRIAKLIRETMEAGACIRLNENALRPAQYGDFAILLRNSKNKAQLFARVLQECGIPVDLGDEEFATAKEVAVLCSLLTVIDNPDSDVALLSVFLSPVFGFSAEDAAALRIGHRDGSLYAALVFAAENGNLQAVEVLDRLERFRLLSVTLPLPKFLRKLFGLTDYFNIVSASADGERRRQRLLLLVKMAEAYTEEGGESLKGFVTYVERQSAQGIKTVPALSANDRVKIMTIHFSKGLQFPVCIVAGTSFSFSRQDIQSDTVYSSEFGVGFRYFDEISGKKQTTLPHEVLCDQKRRISLEEELRLFYVAMTRAEDRLLFTATGGDLLESARQTAVLLSLCGGRPDRAFPQLSSYAEWLLVTSLLHPDAAVLRGQENRLTPFPAKSRIQLRFGPEESDVSEQTEISLPEPDDRLIASLRENMAYRYPYEPLLAVEAKASVSAIANQAEQQKFAFADRPAFMSRNGLTATQRGSAIHKVMQFIDFDKADDLEAELNRLFEWQYLTEEEKNAVDLSALQAFFESDLFERIRGALSVRREMRFLTELPAGRIAPDLPPAFAEEGVMVQGAVDLCFEEPDGVVVVDFKTDRTDDPAALTAAYGEQLSVYALACEKIFGKPVKQRLLYSFALSKTLEIL